MKPQSSQFAIKAVCLATLACFAPVGHANPSGGSVVAGSATIEQQGNTLTVTNTPGAIINWSAFSIGKDEITRFVQQSSQSAVLNRVVGQDPSQILGSLQSNGRVFLINPNGIVFGEGARIDTAGLLASTLNLRDEDFSAGKLRLEGAATGTVRNAAHITTPSGGFVYLIAPAVENNGVIVSPNGEILLAAGASVELVDGVDTSLRVKVAAPAGNVLNVGKMIAEQGRIGIFAAAIRQQGLVSANQAELGDGGKVVFRASGNIDLASGSLTRAKGGEVLIDSIGGTSTLGGTIDTASAHGKGGNVRLLGDAVTLQGSALIDARGLNGGGEVLVGGGYQGKDASVHNARTTNMAAGALIDSSATGNGDAGQTILWADDHTNMQGTILAKGGLLGGNGALVEVSGKQTLQYGGTVDTSAANGKMGTLLLDPTDMTVTQCCGPCGVNQLDVSTIEGSATNFILSANNATFNYALNITSGKSLTVDAAGTIDIYSSITSNGALTLNSGSNITVYSAPISATTINMTATQIGFDDSAVNASSKVTLNTPNLLVGGISTITAPTGIHLKSNFINLAPNSINTSSSLVIEPYSSADFTLDATFLAGIAPSSNAALFLKGGNITLANALNWGGDVTIVAGTAFTNSAGSTGLSSTNGRYLVYSYSPSSDVRGVVGGFSKHYNQPFVAGSTPSYASTGNWFFYSYAPTLYVIPTGGTITYGAAIPGTFTLDSAGLIDGDTMANANVTGAPSFQATVSSGTIAQDMMGSPALAVLAATSGSGSLNVGNYSLQYQSGLASSLGYQFSTYTGSLVVNPATISIGSQNYSKVYDGSTIADLSKSLSGVLPGDQVGLSGFANFDNKNVGMGKTITFSGMSLSGTDSGNYILANSSGSVLGDITHALLTLSGIVIDNKVYDGSTKATFSSTGALSGVINGDNVELKTDAAQFADKNVGDGKTVTISNIALGGTDGGNYLLDVKSFIGKANITRAPSVSWVGGASGNWMDPANWAGGAVPDLANVAAVSIPTGTSITFDGGTVDLDSISSSGTISLSGGELKIKGAVSTSGWQQTAGSLSASTLTVTDSFSQTGGTIKAGNLAITQTAGNTVLGNIEVAEAGISSVGDVTQSGSMSVSGLLKVNAANVTLDAANNSFNKVNIASSGSTKLTDTGDLMVEKIIAGSNINLVVTGNLLGEGAGPHLQGVAADLKAANINQLNMAMDQLTFAASGDVKLQNQKALNLMASQAGGSVYVESFGGLTTSGKVVAGTSLDLITHSPMTIGTDGIQAGTVKLKSFSSAGVDDIVINGNIVASVGSCDVESGGGITQNANVQTSGGGIQMAALDGSLLMGSNASSSSNGGSINYSALGDITLALLDAGSGAVALNSTQGGIGSVGTGLNIRSGSLDASAQGAIRLQADTPPDKLKLASTSGLILITDPSGVALPGSTISTGGTTTGPTGVLVQSINNVANQGGLTVADPQDQDAGTPGQQSGSTPTGEQGQDNDKQKKAKKC
ncbi:YDG domain-containing protein [Chitinimonas sp. BJYL2]|uniref:beta strand repeat-containing protein n=1 Tax=Chitinimonas sp. BJYL2 TaxID=2976696 RepID=UPI0022B52D07|nr:YDG domain-containing protein [Chitinimonas sp. BJYL2]